MKGTSRKTLVNRTIAQLAREAFDDLDHVRCCDLMWDLAEESTEDGGDIPGVQDAIYEAINARLTEMGAPQFSHLGES